MPRRRKFIYTIGTKKHADKPYSVGQIEKWLNDLGVKCKVKGCSLTGFMRDLRDLGYVHHETLDSLAGHNYSQVAILEIYAHAHDQEYVEILLRGLNAEILPALSKARRIDDHDP